MLANFDGSNAQIQWQRFCDLLWYESDLGIWLDVSRMAIGQADLDALAPRFELAFTAMAALEGGAIANQDEQRQVGHYWLRTPELAPDTATTAHINAEVERIETFGRELLDGSLCAANGQPFTDVLWIGIGGSGLGPLLMVRALQEEGQGLPFHFFDNVDPAGMSRTLAGLDGRLATTLVVVVSKSGGTPEPHIGMEQAQARLEARGGQWAGQAVAVTMLDSKLDQVAVAGQWLRRFDMFDWVGGRTSITSAVGLLPAALVGADLRGFLAGAARMDALTRVSDLLLNPAALMAAAWFVAGHGQGKRDMVVLPYRDRLEVFSRYLQQLVMESLGKKHDRGGEVVHQGIAVYGNKGSTDQHAYVQQLRDGVNNFFAVFIEVLKDREGSSLEVEPGVTSGDYLQAFLLGTREALSGSGRANITITINQVDARSVGMLIALFERAVGLYANLLGINAYHQPGVEAGKKAAAETLKVRATALATLAKAKGKWLSVSQVCEEIALEGQEELVFKVLLHVSSNPGAISRQDSPDPGKTLFSHS